MFIQRLSDWILLFIITQNIHALDDDQSKTQAFIPDDLSYSYETDTGIKRSENAQVKNLQVPVVVYTGSYSYTNPDGGQVFVEYVADEKGFMPHVRVVGGGAKAKTDEEGPAIGYPAAGGALIASLVG